MDEHQTQLEKWLKGLEETREVSESFDLTDFATILEENEGR